MNESLTSVIIEGVSQMFGQTSEVSSPHQNMEKTPYYLMSANKYFLYTTPTFVQTQSCRFVCVGNLQVSSAITRS